jgi:DNA-binding response OmpR family regulator
MRPKKVVLCVAASEQTLSVQMLVLETWGYRGVRASGTVEALSILKRALPNNIDLLLLHLHQVHGWELLLAEAKRLQPEIKTVVLSDVLHTVLDASREGHHSAADCYIPARMAAPMELHERIRTLLARKRGPKPLRGVLDATRKDVATVAIDTSRKDVA